MSLEKAQQYFEENDIDSAISTIQSVLRDAPENEDYRVFLIEMLCVNGDLEKADMHLSILMSTKPDLALTVSMWRQLVLAAQTRVDVFSLKAKPELIDEPTPSVQNALNSLIAMKDKDQDLLKSLNADTEKQLSQTSYSINESADHCLRDLDDVNATVFELLGTNGKYLWVDYSQVVEITFHKPTRILELLWRKVTIVLSNGSEGEAFMPATYPASDDCEAKKGLKTDWVNQQDFFQGIGLRTWLIGDVEMTINEMSSLKNNAYSEQWSALAAV